MPSVSFESGQALSALQGVNGGTIDLQAAKVKARGEMEALLQSPVKEPRRKSSLGLAPPPKSASERATLATTILNRYRIEYQNDWDVPVSVVNSQKLIKNYIERGESIELIIPAFPFKSSNRSKKVLGPLPDEAERISLLHLNGLCETIKDVTSNDCHLTIISDGISYNGMCPTS